MTQLISVEKFINSIIYKESIRRKTSGTTKYFIPNKYDLQIDIPSTNDINLLGDYVILPYTADDSTNDYMKILKEVVIYNNVDGTTYKIKQNSKIYKDPKIIFRQCGSIVPNKSIIQYFWFNAYNCLTGMNKNLKINIPMLCALYLFRLEDYSIAHSYIQSQSNSWLQYHAKNIDCLVKNSIFLNKSIAIKFNCNGSTVNVTLTSQDGDVKLKFKNYFFGGICDRPDIYFYL